MAYTGKQLSVDAAMQKLRQLHALGRTTDAVQVIILGTMGQYFLTAGGAKQLSAPHWVGYRDFWGGQVGTGWSVLAIAIWGLAGIFSLAITSSTRTYNVMMSVFSVVACAWCWACAGFQTHALFALGAGNAGLWTWTLAGLFFLFSRLAILIADGLVEFSDTTEVVDTHSEETRT